MRIGLLLALLTACIDSNLVPCGDRACAAGDVCLAGSDRCVTPDQLALCAAQPPDAGCVVGGVAGRCKDGACTPVICGNGIVDPGEVCDDGNQISGDGCSGTCASTEECGNRIIDVARGEGCDCGTPAAPSALCAFPNSADPRAECDLECKPRYCGDGVVDTIEQCDGAAVPSTASCASFGYYHGTVTCSATCQLSPVGCDGRCGDGVIDIDQGEFCDQVVPVGNTCLDLGFDQGALTCSASCSPALSSCSRLGWTTAHNVRQVVTGLWGGGGHVGVIYADGSTYAIAGAPAQATGTYAHVSGTETSIVAASATTYAIWTAGAGWTYEAPPWPVTAKIADVWASDPTGAFVLTDAGTLYHRAPAGTWAADPGSWTLASFAHTRGTAMMIVSASAWTWDGAAWNRFTALDAIDPSGIVDAADDASGRLTVWCKSDQLHRAAGATWDLIVRPPVSGMRALASGDRSIWYAVSIPGPQGMNTIEWGTADETPTRISFADTLPFVTDGREVPYAGFGATGLFRMPRGQWVRPPQPGSLDPVPFRRSPGGYLTYATAISNAQVLDSKDSWQDLHVVCVHAAVTADGTLYCLQATQVLDGAATVGVTGATDLWLDRDGRAIAVAGDHVFAHRDAPAGAWTIDAPAFVFARIIGTGNGDFYATAVADGDTELRLYHYGVTWTPVGLPKLDAADLVVTADAVFAISGGAVMKYVPATGTITTLPAQVTIRSLDGTADDDLFASDVNQPSDLPLWWYDGVTWSPVRTPYTVVTGVFADDRAIMIGSTGSSGATYGFSVRLERTARW